MLDEIELPTGLVLARTTPQFTASTVPKGLLSDHQVADGVWGRLRVIEGSVVFKMADTAETRIVVAGEDQVIPPVRLHSVEPSADAVFAVEFHR